MELTTIQTDSTEVIASSRRSLTPRRALSLK